jgi:2,5-diketo-D-gluconate reductase B
MSAANGTTTPTVRARRGATVQYVETANLTFPAIGFGTWELESVYDNVRHALDVGYRHVDTAQEYDNEADVGRGLADSDVDRGEVFVTTKIGRDQARGDDVTASTEQSLDRLRTDHLDLLLLHWPADDIAPLGETLEAMIGLQDRDLVRYIGVANFPSGDLARAVDLAPIATDQVEHHAYLSVDAIREVAYENGVAITAYSPIARGEVLDDAVIGEIADSHDATPAQVALAFLLAQRDTAVIPKSNTPERITQNLAELDLELADDEVARIAGLARGERQVDPPFAPAWDAA